MSRFCLVIQGGAGTIEKDKMSRELEAAYLKGLQDSLDAGFKVLEKGGTAVNAVKAAGMSMEDNILFNAGRGSVFTNEGLQEMDASIMDGATLKAGAIAGVRNIRNPIELADSVMRESNHVFLCGQGAMDFAIQQQLKLEPDDYFFSQFRYEQWKAMQNSDKYSLDHNHQELEKFRKDKKFGTVGAVACDQAGNIAAATSTGGMTNKKYGRVGDTPIIGAGSYANNKTCAVSCTGHGELFIRAVAAYDVSCLMEYKKMTLLEALNTVVNDKLVKIGGEGGIIGVDAKGNAAMIFNSTGMYRGFRNSDGQTEVAIYKK